MSSLFLPSLIAFSVGAARCASKFIVQISQTGDLKTINKAAELAPLVNTNDEKSNNAPGSTIFDPQTEADRVSQAILLKSFEWHYPECTFIGEEEYNEINYIDSSVIQSIKANTEVTTKLENFKAALTEMYGDLMPSDITIWADPLDGTSDFTDGLRNHVTILIGIVDNRTGKPIAGIVDQPFWKAFPQPNNEVHYQSRTIWGVVGAGCFNLQNNQSAKTHSNVVCTSRNHVDDVVLKTLNSLKVDKVLHTPGAGFKALQVLEQEVDAFVYPTKGSCKWDICATDALFRASGYGKLTDITGNEYTYFSNSELRNTRGVLASSHKKHSEFLKLIPTDVLDMFKQ